MKWCAVRALGCALSSVVLLSALGCARRGPPTERQLVPSASGSAVSTTLAAALPVAEAEPCRESMARLSAEPALPGAPVNGGFERAFLLGRARAEPVLFVRPPTFDARGRAPEAGNLRRELSSDEHPAYAFERVLSKLRARPELAREVFLTEGYLYTASPELGSLFVNYLALGLLFKEPELRLERGAEVWSLRRREGDYEYKDGPQQGERARLLLFDRVYVAGKVPGPALHWDVRPAAAQSLSDELRLDRLTESGALGALRFGRDWLPAAFKRSGGQLSFDCHRVAPGERETVAQARDWAKRRVHVADVLSRVVKAEVEEGLPFDEPKTEEGQQDGQLRPAWRQAYFEGRDRYRFNEDTYWVFDSRGRPHVPQVCIDFVTDTLERAGGSGFRKRGEPREFVRGPLNFDDFALENRRSVETFVNFARAHPSLFDFTETSLQQRVPFRERAAFFRDIYDHRDEYRPFDIVIVFGLRQDGKLHYHSFFVADRDPLTGMPIAVVANAGRPRIRSWENELQNAPQRGIIAHIRPKLPWLEAVLAPEASVSAHEAPPPTGPAG